MPVRAEIKKTLQYEGGYSFDPNDPGGETNFGISKRYHPDLDIKNLTEEQAEEIYLKEYWHPMNCDQYANASYRWIVFDCSVNPGIGHAKQFIAQVAHSDAEEGCRELSKLRADHYRAIASEHPKEAKYLNGWLRRANDLGTDLT